jgi:hypothetical protein
MNLWNAYLSESSKSGFGSAKLSLKTGHRWHTSLKMVGAVSAELAQNAVMRCRYADDKRYVLAKDISFDLLISIYDVDTKNALILRPTSLLLLEEVSRLTKYVHDARMSNIEVRLIGLQNWRVEVARSLPELSKIPGAKLAEVDLFGNELRHIAIDLKTGESYDLLLNNKICTPAELINQTSMGDYKLHESKLNFV